VRHLLLFSDAETVTGSGCEPAGLSVRGAGVRRRPRSAPGGVLPGHRASGFLPVLAGVLRHYTRPRHGSLRVISGPHCGGPGT